MAVCLPSDQLAKRLIAASLQPPIPRERGTDDHLHVIHSWPQSPNALAAQTFWTVVGNKDILIVSNIPSCIELLDVTSHENLTMSQEVLLLLQLLLCGYPEPA